MPESHPPIVDRETFITATELLNSRSFKVEKRQASPLSLKILCGNCGTPFRRTVCSQKVYWVCRKHYKNKNNCPIQQISEEQIHAAFLRVYHKLRLHGEPILKQMISNLMDQDQMLTALNKSGCVDPDIFISQSNELAQQLRAAKQEKERLMGETDDDTIPRTQELLETLETMPEFLPEFDGELFTDLVERITVDNNNTMRFQLKNGLELTESIGRSVR